MTNKTSTATKNSVKTKTAKEKPTVTVTDDSSPEEILHSSWTFLNVVQFFNTFHAYFHLKPFSIEKLEHALLIQKSSNTQDRLQQEDREQSVLSTTSSIDDTPSKSNQFLAEFLVQIIRPLVQKKKTGLNVDTVNEYLCALLPHYGQTDFNERPVLEKIKILKEIQDLHMEGTDEEINALKNENSPEDLRVLPLGTDYEGWTYWYFGDTRLYREIPIPNGKRGTDMMNTTDYTFQLLCATVEEWHQVVKKFQPSKRAASKELASTLCEIGLEVIAKLESRAAALAKKELKMKRAKELELIPKKRSRRLEAKFDEEAKRQKIVDELEQEIALREFEEKERKKREKLQAEQRKQELRVEEARLKKDVHSHITKLISEAESEEVASHLKSLRKQASVTATKNDRLYKMQQWIKLSNLDISLVDGEEINFIGKDVEKALDSLLFKNTLSTCLMTVMKFHTEPDTPTYHHYRMIREKLILNEYQSLNDFCSQLNSSDHDAAHRLLKSIFSPLVVVDAVSI